MLTSAIMDDEHLWDRTGKAAEEAFDRKCEEWQRRDWMKWLGEHLTFPFTVVRKEDEDDAYFEPSAGKAPFRLDHTMEIIGLEEEDDLYGVIAKAREKRQIGHVPLCNVEVTSKSDKNFWPVREYVVWFANR